MPQIGQNLAHYSIVEKIGKGGMGEVFRAKDQKLGRDVAIKVLPEEFARDADRVARFQREAKLLASLNHPNIAAIYGLEESGETNFLVLELVEGDTLADRIKAGPIPVEESLKLALQIAEALEAAHEKGVIHRDLKPANIKVTPEGKVKVLDFGLAKAFAGGQQEETLTYSPTLSELATQRGVILGTAAYMSPEQAKGKTVDRRADVWAFGVVLYEMLMGRQLFAAETVLDTLAGLLTKEPDWEKVPAGVRPVLRRCLQKNPNERLRDIGDVKLELKEVLAGTNEVLMQSVITTASQRKLRLGLPWIAVIVVLSVIIAGVAVWKFKPTEQRQVMRFYHDLPEGQQFSDLGGHALAVSPDGRQFVYSTPKGLYVRSVDELTAKPIAGTEDNPQQPFFSPDGKWIGYLSVTDRKLKKIPVSGGTPVALCDVERLLGPWWNEDGTIAYGQGEGDIMRISANGGTPESIVKQKAGGLSYPQILPDGKSILYTSDPYSGQRKIMVSSLKSGETKELFSGYDARYLPTGHIVFMLPNKSDLCAIPFNFERLEVKGGSVPVLEGVMQYAASESGTLAYIPGTASAAAARQTLVWVNREGKEEPLSAAPNEYTFPGISPDGMRVVLTVGSRPKEHLWIWDLARETMTRLTLDDSADDSFPLWTPDGKRIIYTSSRENVVLGDLYWKAADGTGEVEKLASSPGRGLYPMSWSRDGKTLVLIEQTLPAHTDIDLLSTEGDRKLRTLLKEKYNHLGPKVSPDGQWMAYFSDESGKFEIYVRPFPDANKGKWQVSTSGGLSPLWSPNGRELFYLKGDSVMAVAVGTGQTFKCGKPEALFQVKDSRPLFDMSPDGKRFLMVKASQVAPSASAVRHKINIVVNWFEELKQRVPVK